MNKIEKLVKEKRNGIVFKVIDKLDFMNCKKPIKNLHNYFFVLYYIYDNIDFYYQLKFKASKLKLDLDRIETFEALIKEMNLMFIFDNDIVVQDGDLINSIESFDLFKLSELGFLY